MLNKVDWIGFCYQNMAIDKVKVVRDSAINKVGLCNRVLCSDENLVSLACGVIAQHTEEQREKLIYRVIRKHSQYISLLTNDSRDIYACIYIVSSNNDLVSNDVVKDVVTAFLKELKQITKIKNNKKQREVIKLTALGFDRCQIAKALSMTPRGVDYHIKNAKDFLGAHNKSNMVFLASQQGWLN